MVIRIIDIVSGADTGTQGHAVYLSICAVLSKEDCVQISFEGIDTATSSFVNAAFVQILDNISFSVLKQRLKIVQSSKQINSMIRTRLSQESGKIAA